MEVKTTSRRVKDFRNFTVTDSYVSPLVEANSATRKVVRIETLTTEDCLNVTQDFSLA